MLALTKQLNEMMPNLISVIDEQTWPLNLNGECSSDLIDKQLRVSKMVMAAQDGYRQNSIQKYNPKNS